MKVDNSIVQPKRKGIKRRAALEPQAIKESRGVKRRIIVVPWRNVAEFKEVYNWLYAESTSDATKSQALTTMHTWALRRSLLCPAAVLATSTLVDVQLKDASGSFQPVDLQVLYASAFTRFFNFMASVAQTHSMRTMYETAEQLGLPSFVVDVRHLCAHGQTLPPLEILQQTAQYCMVWLENYYWKAQCENMRDVSTDVLRYKDRTELDDNISRLFVLYDDALKCYMLGTDNIKSAGQHVQGKHSTALKEYAKTHQVKSTRQVLDLIVKDLVRLVKEGVAIKDQSEIFVEAVLKMNNFFQFTRDISDKLLEKLIEATRTLFCMLAVYGFIEELFLSFFELADDLGEVTARRAGASFWAQHIAAGFIAFRKCKDLYKSRLDKNPKLVEYNFATLNVEGVSKRVLKLLATAKVNTKRTILFGDTVRRPGMWLFERTFIEQRTLDANEYTAPVLKSLIHLAHPSFSPKDITFFQKVIDIYFDLQRKSESPKDFEPNKIYTLADLGVKHNTISEHEREQIDTVSDERAVAQPKKRTYGMWTRVLEEDGIAWRTCPLGKLPWD